MNKNLEIIDAVIVNLNRLTVTGIHNMGLVLDSVNALGALRDSLKAEQEEKPDVQDTTE